MKKYFIMVVDGEVAGTFPIRWIELPDGSLHPAYEKLHAILSSDPKIVPSDRDVPEGWVWDGEQFSNPLG